MVWNGDDYKTYYMKSMDNGKTWTELTPLSDSSSAAPNIVCSDFALHMIYVGSDNYIYYRKSINSGDTWSENIKLGHSKYEGRLAVENNSVHVVYYDERDDEKNVYYMRSTNNGETWFQEVKIVNFPSVHPDISVSNGVVHVVWCDGRHWTPTAQIKEIYYKESRNNGIDWGGDTRFTYELGDSSYPRSISKNNDSYVFWSNYNYTENRSYVYFKRITSYSRLPVVNIVSPKPLEIVDGIVWINGTAHATDPNLTIERVEIKMVRMGDEVEWSVDPTTNWNWSSEWIVANGTANWSYAWNVTNLLAGPYTIFARAWDGNNYSECAEVPVYVKRIPFWGATISGLPPEMVYALLIGVSVVIIISIILIYLSKKSKK
ncbi:MAG: hypothetical protein QMC80_01265 [Thermoplasmatales archaeon]|nr:hypothetical protein [Thermoplasmatales archaeon]